MIYHYIHISLYFYRNSQIANAKIVNDKINKPPTEHHKECKGHTLNQLTCEQIDRKERRKIETDSAQVKTLWREVSY
jgi:predicted nucleic acid-binding Zn ribbon protein